MAGVSNPLIVIAAGGTGGHIFPALSVALELRSRMPAASLLWIGTSRSREKELCERNAIPLEILDVEGIRRALSLSVLRATVRFVNAFCTMVKRFGKNRPSAVVAFGGYVCAPVLSAARLRRVPYYLQEQNTIPGLVNRLFARNAAGVFLGFPLAGKRRLAGIGEVTGTPVRSGEKSYDGFNYPDGFDKTRKAILVCGGSQGAQSMNALLAAPVDKWATAGTQVVWQTGGPSFAGLSERFKRRKGMFLFPTITDLYPFYAAAKLVIGRAGASTLSEVSYFGLPCVLIPLPWAAENHQWVNAGLVEAQGWGIRVAQDDACGANVEKAVETILSNEKTFNTMRMRALDNSPADAAKKIAMALSKDLGL
ncbi:MAG TPA: undecaprenyldiphospho-muramoylpentapeptide beta-N-acetylglucosaminyltransferase [Chitinivibrionales bacterium]|nr:undecaprenyldiphospho-muramoylpentapeptide beta-N-acetylglucosaminyltransferase [Chitinivibrionales bacterium]